MSDDGGFQRIVPYLWFDGQAEEAAGFYTSLFEDSGLGATTRYGGEGQEVHGRPEGSVMAVEFEILGQRFVALNGGPQFRFTPAISFFVVRGSEEEVDRLWEALSEGGAALMPLDSYPWGERYGWVQDRYGLTWQVSLGDPEACRTITPSLMFTGEQAGRAEEAIQYWTSVFDDSDTGTILRYGPDEEQPEGTVKHARFRLAGQPFIAMDSGRNHDFGFNEAVSLLVACRTQEEVDRYWEDLGRDGDPNARQCGWLKDRFGVSWQVCPTALQEMLLDPDPEKVARVTKTFLPMKKLDIAELERAYAG